MMMVNTEKAANAYIVTEQSNDVSTHSISSNGGSEINELLDYEEAYKDAYYNWKGYFFDLIDRLVRWQRHEKNEPLELLNISVMKDYENRNSDHYEKILVIGTINDSEADIERAMRSNHPDDVAFFDEMNDWFCFGLPHPGASFPAFYQTCGTIDKKSNLTTVMNELKRECNERYPGAEIKFSVPSSSSGGGCYIATAVYGSYDCPEVWTLRRYRDEKLLMTTFGRSFVKAYYATSPTFVRLFGEKEWFNKFWREKLNRIVAKLKADGYKDTPYYDR